MPNGQFALRLAMHSLKRHRCRSGQASRCPRRQQGHQERRVCRADHRGSSKVTVQLSAWAATRRTGRSPGSSRSPTRARLANGEHRPRRLLGVPVQRCLHPDVGQIFSGSRAWVPASTDPASSSPAQTPPGTSPTPPRAAPTTSHSSSPATTTTSHPAPFIEHQTRPGSPSSSSGGRPSSSTPSGSPSSGTTPTRSPSPPPPPPSAGGSVGATLGSSRADPVPADALFVAPGGSDSRPGPRKARGTPSRMRSLPRPTTPRSCCEPARTTSR